MAADFFKARNGSDSARANGLALHSAYNPEAEAERFANGLETDFIPKNVFIVEAALGYSAFFLRKKFPGAKIGVIRVSGDFFKSDCLWDFSLPLDEAALDERADEGGRVNGNGRGGADGHRDTNERAAAKALPALSERLFLLLGEEGLFESAFFEWPPAAKAWPDRTKEAWSEIRRAMKKAQAVLATREHFGRRWLKNKIRFFRRIQNPVFLEWPGGAEKSVVICASGPSLEGAIESMKKVRSRVFVCALSSAIAPLAFFGVKPDLALSTDGGWWAKKHLDALRKNLAGVPLAIEPESACPSDLLEKNEILPLCYDDDEISKALFEALGLRNEAARRNGTVSGTALEFFLSRSGGGIFFAGLDLAPCREKSHARPNALDAENEAADTRLRPKETRLASSVLPSESLLIYREWFKSLDLRGRRAYRILADGGQKAERLGQIVDIGADEFEKKILAQKEEGAAVKTSAAQGLCDRNAREHILRTLCEKWSESAAFKKELFPADSIIERRAKSQEEKDRRRGVMARKARALFAEIFGEKA